jgi:hypothetical protein
VSLMPERLSRFRCGARPNRQPSHKRAEKQAFGVSAPPSPLRRTENQCADKLLQETPVSFNLALSGQFPRSCARLRCSATKDSVPQKRVKR